MKWKLKSLKRQAQVIQRIQEHNLELSLPNDEIIILVAKMTDGRQLVDSLSGFRFRLRNFCCANDCADQLRELNRSLGSLIDNLHLEHLRDGKENLILARKNHDDLHEVKANLKMVLQKIDDLEVKVPLNKLQEQNGGYSMKASTSESGSNTEHEGNGEEQGQEGETLSLADVAILNELVALKRSRDVNLQNKIIEQIEVLAQKGTKDVNLQNKIAEQIECLPYLIGKLSSVLTLDLSENGILVLPSTIGGLSSLTRLDLHSNRITELPDTIGDLLSLVYLDLRGNGLTSLPSTFGRLVHLEELDLSSNRFSLLPDSIGSFVNLKKLRVDTNDIDGIPPSIGHCLSLRELRADYNRLQALPEAIGKIESLEILSMRYNNIKKLPTTMSSLLRLRELDASFNELESVPESLCFATSLVKMNIGNNFADLRSLPKSIGHLEMLEELDISNNQIQYLPRSFRMLTRLRVLIIEDTPLELPPRHIAMLGAQAVVQYMAEFDRKVEAQPAKKEKGWAQIFFSRSSKEKFNTI